MSSGFRAAGRLLLDDWLSRFACPDFRAGSGAGGRPVSRYVSSVVVKGGIASSTLLPVSHPAAKLSMKRQAHTRLVVQTAYSWLSIDPFFGSTMMQLLLSGSACSLLLLQASRPWRYFCARPRNPSTRALAARPDGPVFPRSSDASLQFCMRSDCSPASSQFILQNPWLFPGHVHLPAQR